MVNIELQLLATILQTGKFEPIIRGDFTADDCLTNAGRIIHDFITTYRADTDGAARFPSLAIAQKRFEKSAIVLPTPAEADTVEALVYEVKLQRLRSRMNLAAQELLNGAESENPLTVARKLAVELRNATADSSSAAHISMRTGLYDMFFRYTNGDLIHTGIEWAWPTLQKHTRGAQRKEFVVISGRPKARKTFIGMFQLAHAVSRGYRAVVFSPEMPKEQMFMRFVAMMAKLRYAEFKQTALDDAEFERFCALVDNFGELEVGNDEAYRVKVLRALDAEDLPDTAFPSIEIIESVNKPISWLGAKIEELCPDIVLCDSVYRQAPDHNRKVDSENARVTAISRGCKDLAMANNVALLATVQINRAGDKTVGDLTNLALSDALGQDADLILRVITGKLNDTDCSALVVLGGRELPIDGVLVHNIPCTDFSEIAAITHKKQVEDLMMQEEAANAKDETEALKQKAATKTFGAGTGKSKFAIAAAGAEPEAIAEEAASVKERAAAFNSTVKAAAKAKTDKAKRVRKLKS